MIDKAIGPSVGMKSLIRKWIEELHGADQTPRLMIDATVEGVDVPDWIKGQWGEALPIDLDPSYPLDLRLEDDGLYCCLSFGGPCDCFFPWRSIYVVQDRDSQFGVVIDANLPAKLETVAEDEADEPVEPLDEEQTAPAPAETATPVEGITHTPPTDAVPDTSPSDSAESRRARFRVIDGGKD